VIGQVLLGIVLMGLTWYGGGPALGILLDILYPNEQDVVRDEWRSVQERYQTISSRVFKRLSEMRQNLGVGG